MFSSRDVTFKHGAVATSVPGAAKIGLEVLKQGGNAVDAAVATAAALTVCEPTSNGIGSDLFALVWSKGELFALDASGPSPRGLSLDVLTSRGLTVMPTVGPLGVNVPGTPAGWEALVQRFGRRTLAENLAPAIAKAREGIDITKTLEHYWNKALKRYGDYNDQAAMESFFQTFGKDPVNIGQKVILNDHAQSLERLGSEGAKLFYRGDLAKQIATFLKTHGGVLDATDLRDYEVSWVKPLKTSFRGVDVYEMPPPTQGVIALEILAILEHLTPASDESARIHQMIEATKCAFHDGFQTLTDPLHMTHSAESLLTSNVTKKHAASIGEKVTNLEDDASAPGGTVYLAAVDGQGTMVSLIQSNYLGFGSGMVVPKTGIALNNRACGFSLEAGHINQLAPKKKTLHTLIPAFLMKDNQPIGPFGLMGGFMQPQGHAQVLAHIFDRHATIQQALDAPRWQWMKDNDVIVEPSFDGSLTQELIKKGHQISVQEEIGYFGRGQILWVNPKTKAIHAATEKRCEGWVAGY